MSSGQSWIVRPIFITGTFRDLHAECDLLGENVFPELGERLRERREAGWQYGPARGTTYPVSHLRVDC